MTTEQIHELANKTTLEEFKKEMAKEKKGTFYDNIKELNKLIEERCLKCGVND